MPAATRAELHRVLKMLQKISERDGTPLLQAVRTYEFVRRTA
jgi:hypothetical protein